MTKTGMGVAQDYTNFNYEPPRPQKEVKLQHRNILVGPEVIPAPKCFSQGKLKIRLDRNPPPYALIMDNLETLLETTVYNYSGNAIGDIVDRLIKYIS